MLDLFQTIIFKTYIIQSFTNFENRKTMTTFMTLLPFLTGILILVLYMVIRKKILKIEGLYSTLGYGFLVMFITAIILLFVWWVFFLEAEATKCWRCKTKQTNTAIIFGFGYEENCCGKMLPGAANSALYDQAISDANYQYLIMQEGVMVAACEGNRKHKKIEMHPVNPNEDVNTFIAAKYAILKMDSLGEKKAVVYAHNHQLARAVFDLKQIAASNPKWQDFEFITPAIPKTPYPRQSIQLRTRCESIYVPLEIFALRLRDTILSVMLDSKHGKNMSTVTILCLVFGLFLVATLGAYWVLLETLFYDGQNKLLIFITNVFSEKTAKFTLYVCFGILFVSAAIVIIAAFPVICPVVFLWKLVKKVK